MKKTTRVGIIICDRYRACTGGKCLRSLRNREGAFDIYGKNGEVELVGFTSCGGCPGGNIEYAPEEMINNGAEVIHLATGLVVGYPPCPYIGQFKEFLEEKYSVKVVIGTHPIPEKYYTTHNNLKTWDSEDWKDFIKPTSGSEALRIQYD